MHGLQKVQLLDPQKHPQSGAQIAVPKILQVVQKAHRAQGSKENINHTPLWISFLSFLAVLDIIKLAIYFK